MYLENLCGDALEPRRLGRFWEAVVGGRRLTDEPDAYETRLTVEGGPVLDLCFSRVPEPPAEPLRVHLDLPGGARQGEEVERVLALGARPADIGQGDVPWVVLADPEGTPFCVLAEQEAYADSGPIAAVPIDSAEPQRDLTFWAWLTGWEPVAGVGLPSLRHPSGRGPLLEFCPEQAPKPAAKNRWHLDIRLDPPDDADAVAAGIAERGGRELHPDWGELPWRVFADPSGNEFCVLPARR